jgi:hypothetical protein
LWDVSGHRNLDAVVLGCLPGNPDDRWSRRGTFVACCKSIDLSQPVLGPIAARLRWWRLFEVHRPTLRTNAIEFDVTRDGQRFLIIEPSEHAPFQTLSLVTNWLPRN